MHCTPSAHTVLQAQDCPPTSRRGDGTAGGEARRAALTQNPVPGPPPGIRLAPTAAACQTCFAVCRQGMRPRSHVHGPELEPPPHAASHEEPRLLVWGACAKKVTELPTMPVHSSIPGGAGSTGSSLGPNDSSAGSEHVGCGGPPRSCTRGPSLHQGPTRSSGACRACRAGRSTRKRTGHPGHSLQASRRGDRSTEPGHTHATESQD